MQKLTEHEKVCFVEDIPFYLLLMYRLHLRWAHYDCCERSDFIGECIAKLEKTDVQSVAEVINAFVERYVLSNTP